MHDRVLNKSLSMAFISGIDQLAYVFTKPLSSEHFKKRCSNLHLHSLPLDLKGPVKTLHVNTYSACNVAHNRCKTHNIALHYSSNTACKTCNACNIIHSRCKACSRPLNAVLLCKGPPKYLCCITCTIQTPFH